MAGGLTLSQKLGVARLALVVERVWPCSLSVLGVVNLYLAFAFYDVPSRLPQAGQAVILALWLVALGIMLWRMVRRIAWPTDFECARRLEQDSGVLHQPLAALRDHPALPGSEGLWLRHQQRMDEMAKRLTPKGPRLSLMLSDPWGLRFWVFVPLAFGLVVGAGNWSARLDRGFFLQESGVRAFDAWIAPPAATGQAPWMLDSAKEGPISIPAGSVLRASVPDGWGRAWVSVDGHSTDFDGDQSQHVQVTLDQVKDLEIHRLFRSLGHWKVQTIADQFPAVAFMRPPSAEEDGTILRVGIEAQDDYGLSRVWMRVHPQAGEDVDVEFPLSKTNPPSAKIEARIEPDNGNLSGQTVSVAAMARDTAGQEATGEPVSLVWPHRNYSDPKANALAQWRQELFDDPSAAAGVAMKLEKLTDQIAALTPTLGLGVARRDLEQKQPDISDAQSLMLGAANELEDRAQMQIKRLIAELGEKLDEALKQGKNEAVKQMAQKYADLLEKLLGGEDKGGASMPFDLQDMQDILGRLDQLAEKKGDDKLRQRLEALAQKLAEKTGTQGPGTQGPGTQGQGGQDPFGNQRGGQYTGDDNTTRVPGQNTNQGLSHILNDIRTRLMDSNRPKSEKDYLKRLLDLK